MGSRVHQLPSSRVKQPVPQSFELAISSLETLRHEIHEQSRKMFFNERFGTSSDVRAQEETVRNCLTLLRTIYAPDPVPVQSGQRLAG